MGVSGCCCSRDKLDRHDDNFDVTQRQYCYCCDFIYICYLDKRDSKIMNTLLLFFINISLLQNFVIFNNFFIR